MEQLAVQMPHSKQYFSLSASRMLWRTFFEIAVPELSNPCAFLSIHVARHIKVYKRKGFK
jgi:hypothetical protein